MKKNIFFICGVLLGMGTYRVSAAETAENDSTFNALDYVLQRPAPARSFEHKKFGDRLFFSADGGPSWMRAEPDRLGSFNRGFRLDVTAGDWITPVHGWRLGLSYGRNKGERGASTTFVGLSADYVMNISSLLLGDNSRRRFELLGIMGGEVMGVHNKKENFKPAGGIRFGIQPRLYLNPTTYFFVEPRLGLYTDALDGVVSWHKYDWQVQALVGLGYRLNGGRGNSHIDNSMFVNEMFRNNLFWGISGSVSALGSSTTDLMHRLTPQGSAHIGKWFSAASGLRLQFGGGYLKESHDGERQYDAMLDLDYMLNLNSALSGYDIDRRVESNLALGVTAAYISKHENNFFPGVHVGLQEIFNVSQNLGIYIEPQVRFFSKKLTGASSKSVSLQPSLSLGLVYRTRSTREYNAALRQLEDSLYREGRHMFLSMSAGTFLRAGGYVTAIASSFNVGKWYTPISAWRLGVDGEIYQSQKIYRYIGGTADYMASLSSLAYGYDPDRIFDVRAFVGVGAGAAYYNAGTHRLVWGPRVGLQAAFRLSDAVDLIIEPQCQVLDIPNYGNALTPEFRAMAGLSYKLESKRHVRYASVREEEDDDDAEGIGDLYAAVSVAPGFFTEALGYGNVSLLGNIAVGGWMNDFSGMQVFYDYNVGKVIRFNNQRIDVQTFGLDYMLNLTRVKTGTRSDRFNLVGLAGIGLGWSNLGDNTVGAAFHLGLQGRWRVARRLELTLSPQMMLWTRGIMANPPHNVFGNGSIAAGAAYSF